MPALIRSRSSQGLTSAASRGRLELQVCRDCDAVQYPPRVACHRCLSLRLVWRLQSGLGELIAETTLAHSQEEYFRVRLPWRIGMVRLDTGQTLIVHLHGKTPRALCRVRVGARLDIAGQAALIGFPEQDGVSLADDPQLHSLSCDPRSRKVLITDGRTAVGRALVPALIGAGADVVWVGHAESPEPGPELKELARLTQVRLLPLDVAQARSVQELAAQIGEQLDILIGSAEPELTHVFGPVLQAREVGIKDAALAWVNLLPVAVGASLASQDEKPPIVTLAQSLRAQLRPAGIRVINAFQGPPSESSEAQPAQLAAAIVTALQEGIEDVYPDGEPE